MTMLVCECRDVGPGLNFLLFVNPRRVLTLLKREWMMSGGKVAVSTIAGWRTIIISSSPYE
jgi:hypothetical protein